MSLSFVYRLQCAAGGEMSHGRVEGSTQRVEGSTQRVEGSTQRVEGSTQRVEGSTQRVEGSTQRVEGSTRWVEGSTRRVECGTQPAARPRIGRGGPRAPRRAPESCGCCRSRSAESDDRSGSSARGRKGRRRSPLPGAARSNDHPRERGSRRC